MRKKHRQTIRAIHETGPVRSDIRWSDVEAMIRAAGGEIGEGRGSRVRIALNGEELPLHKPHPRPVMDKGAVVTLRRFLERAGLTPDDDL